MTERVKLHFQRYDYAAFLTNFSYAASSLVVPVSLVQIASSLGFPLDQGGLGTGGAIQMARSISMTILLILSSFIAGRFSMRITLGLSTLIMGIGCLGAALAPNYWILFAALAFTGCGEGYIEAVTTPFVQKLHTKDTGQYMNFAHSFWSVGVATTTIGAGVMLLYGCSWRIVVGCAFLLALAPALALLLPERKGHEFPESHRQLSPREVLGQLKDIVKVPRFWLFFFLMFIAGGSEYCLTFWLASFLQMNMKSSALLGGLATAVFAGGMIIGRMGWGILVPQAKLGKSLLCASLAGLLLSCAIPFINPAMPIGRNAVLTILFVLLLLIGITIAPLWPTIQTYSIDRLPQHLDETVIFILLSSAGVPGCGFFSMLMGFVGDWLHGLDHAFFLVPACQLCLSLAFIWEIRQKRAGNGSPIDMHADAATEMPPTSQR